MAQEFAKPFYNSRKWRKCREAYIEHRRAIDGGLCETCQSELGYIVHHKIVLTPDNINDDTVTLAFEHLEYDCKNCHDTFDGHGLNKAAKPLCVFDETGQPISVREIDRRGEPPFEQSRLESVTTVAPLLCNTQVAHIGGVV